MIRWLLVLRSILGWVVIRWLLARSVLRWALPYLFVTSATALRYGIESHEYTTVIVCTIVAWLLMLLFCQMIYFSNTRLMERAVASTFVGLLANIYWVIFGSPFALQVLVVCTIFYALELVFGLHYLVNMSVSRFASSRADTTRVSR